MDSSESLLLAEADPRDLGFVIRGTTLEVVFQKVSEHLLAATVERHDSVRDTVKLELELFDDTLELVFSRFLQEVISLRETQGLLLRAGSVQLCLGDEVGLRADLTGEAIDPGRHGITRDVKAPLVRQLCFSPSTGNWEVMVRLDA